MKALIPPSAVLVVFLSLAAPRQAVATLSIYSGVDNGVGPTDPRPNSDAAAANFHSAISGPGFGPAGLIDFESSPLGGFVSMSSGDLGVPGVSISPAASSDGDDTSIVNTVGDNLVGFNTTAGGANYLSIDEQAAGELSVGVSFEFSTPILGFGSYITGVEPGQGLVTVVFDNGTVQSLVPKSPVGGGSQFFGFVDTMAVGITRVSMIVNPIDEMNNNTIGVDDVRFGAVPEPSTFLLLGLGLLGLMATAVRGHQRRVAA